VIDNVFAPDEEWIALTEGEALTVATDIQALINGAVQGSSVGVASGIAPLDTQSEVPDAHLNVTLTDAAASDTPLPTAKTTIRSLLQSIRNVLKWLATNKVDKNGTDRLMTAAEGAKLTDIQAGAQVNPGNATQSAAGLMSANDKTRLDSIAGIIPLTVGLYSNPADLYISRDDLYTFLLPSGWKDHLRAYLKSGFVYISGYLQFAATNPVVPKFGMEANILRLGNPAYAPMTGVDYCGTAGDYQSGTGSTRLSLNVMMRYQNNDFKLGQIAPASAQAAFFGYILLNIMYPIP
jgi:hypothetical protein